MISLGENIYLWRVFKGLSQEELAKKAGIPRPNLSAIESGKREPSLTTLRALAVSLGTTPGVLINGIAPVHFKGNILLRKSLEKIVQLSLGRIKDCPNPEQKTIALMLSDIVKNKINASNKVYKNTLKGRQTCINSWLMFKASVGTGVLNNLLTRLDKHIGHGQV